MLIERERKIERKNESESPHYSPHLLARGNEDGYGKEETHNSKDE